MFLAFLMVMEEAPGSCSGIFLHGERERIVEYCGRFFGRYAAFIEVAKWLPTSNSKNPLNPVQLLVILFLGRGQVHALSLLHEGAPRF